MIRLIQYVGGPRHGTTRAYMGKFTFGPATQGCADEARRDGMYGLYRKSRNIDDETIEMVWQELPYRKLQK